MALDFSWLNLPVEDQNTLFEKHNSAITSDRTFSDNTIEYSFYSDNPQDEDANHTTDIEGSSPEITSLNPTVKDAVKANFDILSNVLGVEFQEVDSGSGDIRLGHANLTVSAIHKEIDGYSNVFVDDNSFGAIHNTVTRLALHETGHALGLTHPVDYNTEGGGESTDPLPESLDTNAFTIMSYNNTQSLENVTFTEFDMFALSRLYGTAEEHYDTDHKIFSSTEATDWNFSLQSDNSTESSTMSVALYDEQYVAPATAGVDTLDFRQFESSVTVFSDQAAIDNNGRFDSSFEYFNIYEEEYIDYDMPESFGNVRIFYNNRSDEKFESVTLTEHPDVIHVGDRFSKINAFGGKDIFYGFDSNSIIDGGSDDDRLEITSSLENFIYATTENGLQVTEFPELDSMLVRNVETIMFSGTEYEYSTSPGQKPQQVYRLYEAAFDRKPDPAGLGYWISESEKGKALYSMGAAFISSDEFREAYGQQVSDEKFVRLVYENVLEREPDEEGLDYWVGEMESGRSRESVLIGFSESEENVENLSFIKTNGIFYESFDG